MSGVTLSSVVAQPRSRTVVLTSSNAAVPVPEWAGLVYVTGCGAGASGSIISTTGSGAGGAAGAFAIRHPIPIPDAVSSIAVTVGAAGAAVGPVSSGAGNAGGTTSITVDTVTLHLGGGLAPAANSTSPKGGVPRFDNSSGDHTSYIPISNNGATMREGLAASSTLGVGSAGGSGNNVQGYFGAGGWSPFGGGGAGRWATPAVDTNGEDATGYGAGGSGGRGTATSGAGSPGMVILEFVETF